MSVSDAQEFLRQMASDPALARLDAAAHRRQLVKLAREKGFKVTDEDPAEAARAAQSAPYGELEDVAQEGMAAGFSNGTYWNMTC